MLIKWTHSLKNTFYRNGYKKKQKISMGQFLLKSSNPEFKTFPPATFHSPTQTLHHPPKTLDPNGFTGRILTKI